MEIIDNPEFLMIIAKVEVPGMRESDISLQLHYDFLTVSGERRPTFGIEERIPQSIFPVRELKYGKFFRPIPTPPGLQVSQILCFEVVVERLLDLNAGQRSICLNG